MRSVAALAAVVATSGAVLGALLLVDLRALWVLLAAGVLAAVQLLGGAWLALRIVRARPVTSEEMPAVRATLDRLSQLADMPAPRLALAQTAEPIALAVRHPGGHGTICLGRGLLESLEPAETEAVLAHELAHLAHRDATVMTTAASLPALAGLMIRAYWWDGVPHRLEAAIGRSRREPEVAACLSALGSLSALGMIVFRVVAFVPAVVLSAVAAVTLPAMAALSRAREYAADRHAALLTGAPSVLASALLRIDAASAGIPTRDFRAAGAVNALLIHPSPTEGCGTGRRCAATRRPTPEWRPSSSSSDSWTRSPSRGPDRRPGGPPSGGSPRAAPAAPLDDAAAAQPRDAGHPWCRFPPGPCRTAPSPAEP